MNTYIMRLWGPNIPHPWQIQFTQPSDHMAMEYAKKICENDHAIRAATEIDLFNKDEDRRVGGFEIRMMVVARVTT